MANPVLIGKLTIPAEIIFEILRHLDYLQITCLANTSRDIKNVIENFPVGKEKVILCKDYRKQKYTYSEINKMLSDNRQEKKRIVWQVTVHELEKMIYVFGTVLLGILSAVILKDTLGFQYAAAIGAVVWSSSNFFVIKRMHTKRKATEEGLDRLPEITFCNNKL